MAAYLMELNVNKTGILLLLAICNMTLALLNAFVGNIDMANFSIGWAIILLCMVILRK